MAMKGSLSWDAKGGELGVWKRDGDPQEVCIVSETKKSFERQREGKRTTSQGGGKGKSRRGNAYH